MLGSESVMVNDLAVTAAGDVYAVASAPGQVLQLIPRAEGTSFPGHSRAGNR